MAAPKSSGLPTGLKPRNKLRRQSAYLRLKTAKEAAKRDERFKRKREEAKKPELREERHARNVPTTIESKRVWDIENLGDEGDALGWSVDVERLVSEEEAAERGESGEGESDQEEGLQSKLKKRDEAEALNANFEDEDEEEDEDEADSMLDSDSDSDSASSTTRSRKRRRTTSMPAPKRASSPSATSTATNLKLSPEFLRQKFPAIFNPPETPKILVTTSINSTLHKEAEELASVFPNSTYIRRTSHIHAHKYSVREIASYASARSFTALVILMQAQHEKKPDGLDVVILPSGPHMHFSLTNWIGGRKLPEHGVDQGFHPELILKDFRTPLGILTAHVFQSLFPAQPDFKGRTVVALLNSRDYIFFTRRRYDFRQRRPSEKSVTGTDGKPIQGMEEIRAPRQKLGPEFTLKLRRIDRGIQRKSGQEWQWKGRMEKQRTRFNM